MNRPAPATEPDSNLRPIDASVILGDRPFNPGYQKCAQLSERESRLDCASYRFDCETMRGGYSESLVRQYNL
jgi:hypothetical protein